MVKLALGHHHEASQQGTIRAVMAEVILTFLFVFSNVGSTMSTGKVVSEDSLIKLSVVVLVYALVVAVMISTSLRIFSGHLNPAVTPGLAVGGHITLVCSALYIVAQLVGSSLACYLL